MINPKLLLNALLILTAATWSGCLRPKRADDTAHSYLLSPSAVRGTGTSSAMRDLRLGIAPVEIPTYLLDKRIVLRKGNSEVRYLENHRWAERLDKGVQRALGFDLSILLDTDHVSLSSWLRQAVQAELYLAMQRFDYDDQGQVLLEARWRVAAPGGERTLATGHSHVTRHLAVGVHDVDSAVTELSRALAEMSQEIAAALPGALASSNAVKSQPSP